MRPNYQGIAVILQGDTTTTAGVVLEGTASFLSSEQSVALMGHKVFCPVCKTTGVIAEGCPAIKVMDIPVALHGHLVTCICPTGSHRLIAQAAPAKATAVSSNNPATGLTNGFLAANINQSGQTFTHSATINNVQQLRQQAKQLVNKPLSPPPKKTADISASGKHKVFTKSCTLPAGCTDAGTQAEEAANFGELLFFKATTTAKKTGLFSGLFAANAATTTGAEAVWQPVIRRAATAGGARLVIPRFSAPIPSTVLVMGLLYSPEVGKGSDQGVLTQEMIRKQAAVNGSVNTRVRFFWQQSPDDQRWRVYGVHTSIGSGLESVRTRQMAWNAQKQHYEFMPIDNQEPIITWTPADPPEVPKLEGLPIGDFNIPTLLVQPIEDFAKESQTEFIPVLDPAHFNDFILSFPDGSNIPPLYIYFNTPRNQPGKVTGQGVNVTGIWLAEAGKGLGVPIPAQIADKLRGQTFTDFDKFREAFWREVANDQELAKQFNKINLANMKKLGTAPFASLTEQVGLRKKFELHHIKLISKDGAVYDIDNIRVMTPKKHINTHK